MKTLLALAAAGAFALATTSAFAFGAHNPVPSLDPGKFECTLIGPHSYANDPSCETALDHMIFVSSGGFGCIGQSVDPLKACYVKPKP